MTGVFQHRWYSINQRLLKVETATCDRHRLILLEYLDFLGRNGKRKTFYYFFVNDTN